jgi:sugar lactone lactonase YvrE
VGAVALLGTDSYLVATRDALVVLRGDRIGAAHVIVEDEDVRTNDGAADPAGRFLIGTMAYDAGAHRGGLYVRETDGSVRLLLADVTVSNGLAWAPTGDRLYYVDSATQGVDVLDYDVETGTVAHRRRLVSIPDEDGIPDGLTVDADGALWVALWGGGEVRRYSPTGAPLETVHLPVPMATSCGFGGPALDTLFITTASHDRSTPDPRGTLDGTLFGVYTGVVGRQEPVVPAVGGGSHGRN